MFKLFFTVIVFLSTLALAQDDYKAPVNLLKCDGGKGYADIRYIPQSNLLDITVGDADLKEQNFSKILTDDEIGMIQDGTWSITFRDYQTSKFIAVNISSNTNAIFFLGQSSQGMECHKTGEIE